MNLSGIPYRWGGRSRITGIDCFVLASLAQVRYGRSPLPDHDWVYQQYDNDTFPPQKMLELLQDTYGSGTVEKQHLNLVAIQAETVILGTLLKTGEEWDVLHFNQTQSVLTPLKVLLRRHKILGMWNTVQ